MLPGMKSSTLTALLGGLAALILFWFAWQGFQLVRWNVRYMMPAFVAGVLVGGIAVGALSGRN